MTVHLCFDSFPVQFSTWFIQRLRLLGIDREKTLGLRAWLRPFGLNIDVFVPAIASEKERNGKSFVMEPCRFVAALLETLLRPRAHCQACA